MKIALVTHWLSSRGGGVVSVVESLSAALLARGATVCVFGLRDDLWLTERIAWRGSSVQAFPAVGPPALGFSPSLGKALRDFRPDIIHTHGIWMFTSAIVARCGAAGIPYIVSPHGMLDGWALGISRMKKLVARMLFENRHLSGATCLHALTAAEEKALRAFGLTGPVFAISNGVDLPDQGNLVAPPWAGKFAAEAEVLLFLGRLHPKKNVAGLLRALKIMLQEDALGKWVLAIVGWGQGGHDDELKAMADELGLGSCVVFLGPLHGEQKDAAFRHAEAFVLPSHSEGLPMAVLEAWSYGLPVAMTMACNIPEGFQVGAAKEIPTSPSDLASALGEFLGRDKEELRRMGQRGRALVEEKYSWSVVAAQFIDVYQWMLREKSVPPEIATLRRGL